MSKIFNGDYTRLDDDVSFQLVRTNPILTTNTKLMYDGENIFFESYDANPLLVTQKYKNYKVSGKSPYNHDIRNFLTGTKNSAYDVHSEFSDFSVCDSYDKQFETLYWCGAESINSKQYKQELGFVAPLYLRKKLPNYFVIFKIDGPSNFNLNKDENNEEIDGVFDFNSDILKKARIIKSFDLREGTHIGEYLKRYIEQPGFDFDKSVYVNFSSFEITYYGIDKKYGVLTSKTENFKKELLENDNTITHTDDWITEGFKRNNLIFPYIINFEFLFDDNDTEDFKFSRYFGLYCNDIDLFDFEARYKDKNIVVDKPENLLKKTILTGTNTNRIKLIFDTEKSFFSSSEDSDSDSDSKFESDMLNSDGVLYDKTCFNYIKDKFNNLHQVYDVIDNYIDIGGSKIIEITDKTFDLSSVCGFEPVSLSAYCEKVKETTDSLFSMTIKKKFRQGEYIEFCKNGIPFKTITAVGDEDENPLKPRKYKGTKFSTSGTLEDMTKALCDCINSLNGNEFYFEAVCKNTTIVLKYASVSTDFDESDIELLINFDQSLFDNRRIVVEYDTNEFEEEFGTRGCVFKVKKDERAWFKNGRFLKTWNPDEKNAKILSCIPYMGEDDNIETEYYEVRTDNEGVHVNISGTNQVEIVDRFYPKFGFLSFFPVMDFDFDTVFSRYGNISAFKSECENLEEKSKFISSVIELDDSDVYERGNITKLSEGFLWDYNGRGIENEYEYFMENLIPELSVVNKSVPYINKWGYYDDSKDSCENPYRLNTSKIFGTSNLSSNTFSYLYSLNEHTHSMPYYVTKDKSMCEGNHYQYVYDSIGIYNDETYMTYEPFVQRCVGLFMDTDVNNFEKLVCNKNFESRFVKKYSRMKFGSEDTFATTLFRGVKFNIKKFVDDEEVKSSDYNDYKFTFLYIPIEIDSIYFSNKVYFVKNDKFKFIVGFVVVNTMCSAVTSYDSDVTESDFSILNPYDLTDFSKAYLYGGCYGLLSLPATRHGLDEFSTVTLTNMPIFDVFNITVENNGYINVKNVSVINQSILTMLETTDTSDCIRSIVFHNSTNTFKVKYDEIVYENGIINILNFVKSTWLYIGDMEIYVDITFRNVVDEETDEPVFFKDFYKMFESLSTYNIKENINDEVLIRNNMAQTVVSYFSTNGDKYKMNIEDPVSFNTYDIFTSTPQILPGSGVSMPCYSEITLKNNVNDISLKTINRYSGYYNPIFNEIVMFGDYKNLPFTNSKFNQSFKEDIYGAFGKIKNLWFHKVNEEHPNNIITMMSPLYPAIGQFALDYRDYNIFESSWDKDYYTKQIDLDTNERIAGTAGTKNTFSMFGSKYMNLPETITIDTFGTSVEWDDSFISSPDLTDADVMFKEVNGNVVKFYIFLKKRIVRYFLEESGLRKVFEEYVNPDYSFGDHTTIEDDIISYIEKNILKLYAFENLDVWVKTTISGLHDSTIENDYSTYLKYDNGKKKKKNMKKTKTFSIKGMSEDRFDKYVTYNLKTGYMEDFGFSFTIKKI